MITISAQTVERFARLRAPGPDEFRQRQLAKQRTCMARLRAERRSQAWTGPARERKKYSRRRWSWKKYRVVYFKKDPEKIRQQTRLRVRRFRAEHRRAA